MKTVITLLCIVLLFAFISACSGKKDPDLVELVEAYENAHNADNVEAAMAMFADDAVFELVGQGTLPNLEAVRAIHMYDVGIQSRINFHDCNPEGLTVTCQVAEQNDWLETTGIGEVSYTSSVFIFNQAGKIQKMVATMSPEDGAAIGAVLAEFVPWLFAERPQESQQLFTPEGVFIYSEENGVLVVEMLNQWRSES